MPKAKNKTRKRHIDSCKEGNNEDVEIVTSDLVSNVNKEVANGENSHTEMKRAKRKTKQNTPKKSKITTQSINEEENSNLVESAEFMENNKLIRFSMEGQDTEFRSDLEEDSESDDDEVFINNSQGSRNNNSTKCDNKSFSDGEIDSEEENADQQKGKATEYRSVRPIIKIKDKDRKQIIGEAIGQAVPQVQDLLTKSGLLETAELMKRQLNANKERRNKCRPNSLTYGGGEPKGKAKTVNKKQSANLADKVWDYFPNNSNSEITLYQNAVQDGTGLQNNSTSEEDMDISDESNETNNVLITGENGFTTSLADIDNFIADCRRQSAEHRYVEDEQRPSTSRERPDENLNRMPPITTEHRSNQLLRQAEAAKAKIFQVPGESPIGIDNHNRMENNNDLQERFQCTMSNELAHSVMVDERYLSIGGHLDEQVRSKIISGEYVEFEKLLPRDRIRSEEDQRMQIVNRGNQTFWVPYRENTQSIHNFGKWEQAFRVFTNVYVQKYPNRASELVQYSHLIHTASLTYIWENVYSYDKDFRIHLANFPSRSWTIILQQAWAIILKDRIRNQSYDSSQQNGNGNGKHRSETFNYCRRFNKGICTTGASCRYEHRCKYCRKFGHGIHNCRKLKADKANGVFNKTNRGDSVDMAINQSFSKPEPKIRQESNQN